jgi:hypothetical protein
LDIPPDSFGCQYNFNSSGDQKFGLGQALFNLFEGGFVGCYNQDFAVFGG